MEIVTAHIIDQTFLLASKRRDKFTLSHRRLSYDYYSNIYSDSADGIDSIMLHLGVSRFEQPFYVGLRKLTFLRTFS